VVEDDEVERNSIVELIGNSDVCTTAVGTGAAALAALAGHFDCVVLDLGLPDMTGFELIEQTKQEVSLSKLPIIVYTGKELALKRPSSRMAENHHQRRAIAGASPRRNSLFLHRVQANLPYPARQMLDALYQTDPILAGKKVLIVRRCA